MRVLPSIDLLGGKCVKLVEGRPGSGFTVSLDPLSVAKMWEREGAPALHVVDLDGAIYGVRKNAGIIRRMLNDVTVPVQVGGGLRSLDDIIEVLDAGAKWAIVGTALVEDETFLDELFECVPSSRIIAALDARRGFLVKRGWSHKTKIPALDLAQQLDRKRLFALLYTAVEAEGRLASPQINLVARLANSIRTPVMYAGGVSSLEDVAELAKAGVEAVVIGSALYRGKFTLEEAMEVANTSR